MGSTAQTRALSETATAFTIYPTHTHTHTHTHRGIHVKIRALHEKTYMKCKITIPGVILIKSNEANLLK